MISPQVKHRPSLWKSRWLSLILILADAVFLALCWKFAYQFRAMLDPMMGPINEPEPYTQVFPLIVLVGLMNNAAFGLYIHRRRFASLNQPSVLMKAGYHWLLYIVVIGFFFKALDLGRSVILFAALFGLIYLFASRTIFKALKGHALLSGRGTVRSAIAGNPELALEIQESLTNHPEIGYTLLGLISVREIDSETREKLKEADIPVLGSMDRLKDLVVRHRVEELFLAIADLSREEQFRLLNDADMRGISVHAVSDIFGVISQQAKMDDIGAFPVITLRDGHLPLHQAIMKRFLDVSCALAGTIIWLLFFHWWIAIAIKRSSPGPVFFKQERVGRDGRLFTMIKYRTMYIDAEPYATAPSEEDDPRITAIGRWLRKTSLDELPQLINVLRGDMAMVGPRPEMPFIVEEYEAWERRRLAVKPGLTGLWQVVGRKNLPLHLNMQYDFYYIKNQSFLLDVEILLKTIPAVLKGKGAF